MATNLSDVSRSAVHRPARPVRASTHPWRPLLVRMHFFSGVLVGPLLVLACLTGLAYTFTPQIQRLLYANEFTVEPAGRTAMPLSAQVAAAAATRPGQPYTTVTPGATPEDTTRVDFADPALPPMGARSVFVDPYTAAVRGEMVTRHGQSPLTSWLSQLHGDLHLGEPGRVYIELASCWLLIMTVGGLLLWWERAHRHVPVRSRWFWRRLLLVDHSHPGLHRTMSWHSTVALWTGLVAVVLAVSGLTFSAYAGERWKDLTTRLAATTPRVNPSLPGAVRPIGGDPGSTPNGAHADHQAPATHPSGLDVDAIRGAAARAGITEAVRLTAPTRPGTGWVVAENDNAVPINLDQVVIDPATGNAVRTLEFAQYPFLAKAYRLGMQFHFGRLFGLVNQLILALTMLGLLAVTFWGYRMWWQRRPRNGDRMVGRLPQRGAWRSAPRVKLVIGAVVLLWLMITLPVFGVSVLIFVAIDFGIGWWRGRPHHGPDTELDAELPDTEPDRSPLETRPGSKQ